MISYIAIGSNLGDRISNIKKSIKLISKSNKILKISPLYITKPMYFEEQPYFINCVIKIKTNFFPHKLLKFLNSIEEKLGRKRVFKNSPRTIDLDILYFNNLVINEENLKIPHPGLYERAFVLKPFCDIEPFFKDPILNKNIFAILAELKYDKSDIIKIPQKFDEIENFFLSLRPHKKNDFSTFYVEDTLDIFLKPQNKLKGVIHITGSVGKTSVAVYLSKMLLKSGYKILKYTSPHIYDFRERISINGRKIFKKDFLLILIDIISKSRYIHSFFEYLTLIAIIKFSKTKHDFCIIEVGMGGKNDATNVFKKSISVFTEITLEHKKYLGKSLVEITENKAGIIKNNSKVFIDGTNKKTVIDKIKYIANSKRCKIFIFNDKDINFQKHNLKFAKFIYENLVNSFKKKIDFKPIKIPARLEIKKYNGIKILIDGSHTPLSIKKLLSLIKKDYQICLCGFMKDKEIEKMLDLIEKYGFEKIILSKSYSYRSFNPEIYKERFEVFDDLEKAFEYAVSFGKNIVVTGSLYFCSDVLKLLKKDKIIYFPEL